MANYPYQAYAQRVKVTPLLSLALLAALPGIAAAQVTIHEVCASNIDLVNDEDGKSSDWIELWNHPVQLRFGRSLRPSEGGSWEHFIVLAAEAGRATACRQQCKCVLRM